MTDLKYILDSSTDGSSLCIWRDNTQYRGGLFVHVLGGPHHSDIVVTPQDTPEAVLGAIRARLSGEEGDEHDEP